MNMQWPNIKFYKHFLYYVPYSHQLNYRSYFPAKKIKAGATVQLVEIVKNNKAHGAWSFLKNL
jgi:hypothetical protein